MLVRGLEVSRTDRINILKGGLREIVWAASRCCLHAGEAEKPAGISDEAGCLRRKDLGRFWRAPGSCEEAKVFPLDHLIPGPPPEAATCFISMDTIMKTPGRHAQEIR